MPARHHRVRVAVSAEVHVFSLLPEGNPPFPTVVVVHGTIGSGAGGRRWRLRFGRRLSERGIAVVNFDHRGCGYSDGEFEDTTVSTRIEDLHAVIESLDFAAKERIGLMGASLGSAVAVLYEARRPTAKAAVLYTLPCEMAKNYPRWFEARLNATELDRWQAGERVFVSEEFFRQAFLDDLQNHDVLAAMPLIKKPLLLIQPKDDSQVSEAISSKAFALAAHDESQCEQIDGDHTFDDDEEQESRICHLAEEWFVRYL